MTRKHFVALANAISWIRDINARREAAEVVASVCQQFSDSFDKQQFYAACCIIPTTGENHGQV